MTVNESALGAAEQLPADPKAEENAEAIATAGVGEEGSCIPDVASACSPPGEAVAGGLDDTAAVGGASGTATAATAATAAEQSAATSAGTSREPCLASEPWRSRIVFLDIDGVLNRTRDAKHIRVDEDLVARLRDFVKTADTGIVLSTYWRHFTDYIRFILFRYKIPQERVLDRTPGRGHLGWRASDDKAYESRSHEISDWLAEHPEVESFVILDDREAAGRGVLAPHFVHVKTEEGLTQDDVRAAYKALKQPRPPSL